jgi:hypothetical protein
LRKNRNNNYESTTVRNRLYRDVSRQASRKKGLQILARMETHQTAILNQLSDSHADNMAYSRFFNNESISISALKESSQVKVKELSKGSHVLCIQDTSVISYEKHRNFFRVDDADLGPVDKDKNIGFFLHPMLVVDTEGYFPLGFSTVHCWNRSFGKPDKHQRGYKKLPIEEKESYRWISTGEESIGLLKDSTTHMTIIADRESDISQEFVQLKTEHSDLLLRSREDRPLYGEDKWLYEYLSDQPQCGTYKIQVRSDKRKNREGRDAMISLRYCKVRVRRPGNTIDKSLPEYIELTAIEAREDSSTVPGGEKPILWRLLTTHQVNDQATAILMVSWYKARWLIEELFRLLKQQGIDIESSQLESGKGLKKLAVMALEAALKILQLCQGRDSLCPVSESVVFSQNEIEFAEAVSQSRYEGKTQLQKNPYPKGSLARMSWIIARMGGWKGYLSTGKPGPITMKRGLDKFNTMYQGQLINKHNRDVYKE